MPCPRRLTLDRLEPREVPAVFVVTTAADAGPGSLREAVDTANAEHLFPGPDSIQFAPHLFGQPIRLSTVGDTSFEPSALAVTSAITIDGFAGYTGGAGVTIARDPAVDTLRLFLVTPTGSLTLSGLTLRDGLARGGDGTGGGGGGGGLGGAIFNRGTLTVDRCLLTANVAVGGNGLPGTGTGDGGGVSGGRKADARLVYSPTVGLGGVLFPRVDYYTYAAPGGFGGGGAVGEDSRQTSFGVGPPPDFQSVISVFHPSPGGAGGFGGGGGGGGGNGGLGTGDGGGGGFAGGAGANGSGTVFGIRTLAAGTRIFYIPLPGGGGGGAGLGGAIINHGGVVTVTGSTLAGNGAYGGGGVNPGRGLGGGLFNLNGAVTVVSSTVTGNDGGGLYVLAHDASGGVGNANPATLTLLDSAVMGAGTGDDLTALSMPGSGGARLVPLTPVLAASPSPAGGPTEVRLLHPLTGQLVRGFVPFPGFRGQVYAVTADVTGDRVPDILAAAGAGGGPHVKLFDGATGAEVFSFYAYDPWFPGGVSIAAGDVDGDGVPDLITGAGAGGGPHVKAFSGVSGLEISSFYAYDPFFPGGVSVAAGDFNRDGIAEVVTAAGSGGGPHVKVFRGIDGAESAGFYAYDPWFPGGVSVAVGDVTGDGVADIVTGAGPGGGPHVRAFDGVSGAEVLTFYAYDPFFPGGVSVAVHDTDGDGIADVVTGAGAGGDPHLKVFDGYGLGERLSLYAFDPGLPGGVSVG